MKNRILVILIIFTMSIISACSAKKYEKEIPVEEKEITYEDNAEASPKIDLVLDKDIIKQNFEKLTETSRRIGTDGEMQACNFLKSQLEGYGFNVYIQEFNIYNLTENPSSENYFDLNPNNSEAIAIGHNVIADLKPYDPEKKTLIFSAHYDTTENSLGALDNGSGVCSLLEASRLISQKDLDYNLRIIFFSSEEYGLQGSRSYINSLDDTDFESIIGCFNIDMVGNVDAYNFVFDLKKAESNALTTEFERIFPDIKVKYYPGGGSDHMPFIHKGILSFRYTTSDYQSSDFDTQVLKKETDTKSVSLDRLAESADIIYGYMLNVEVENLI